jgi:hypothetical protein
MQLHFETEEFDVVANMLLEETRRSPGLPTLSTEDILDRVLARKLEFGFDELDYLLSLATVQKQSLTEEISRTHDPETKAGLQRRKLLVEHVMDKLTEACAML